MRCHDPPRRASLRRPRRSSVRPHPACPSSIAFRSVRVAAGLPAVRPCFARIAWARPPAFAPARFAHLIARASQAQVAPLPSIPLGIFRAVARQEAKRPPDAASSCPILPQFYGGQALIRNYFIIHERIATSVPKTSSSPTPDPLSPGSPPHRRAVRVEERLCLQAGGTEVAEDFDFPAVLFRRQHLATSISRTSRPTELPTRRHLLRP